MILLIFPWRSSRASEHFRRRPGEMIALGREECKQRLSTAVSMMEEDGQTTRCVREARGFRCPESSRGFVWEI